MSTTRSIVVTVVQLDPDSTPSATYTSKGPGVVGLDIQDGTLRLSVPEDVQNTRDWMRQVLAAVCEAI